MVSRTIVLGSTSPFRKSLLEKLNIPFECSSPNIDESELYQETPVALVERLAIEKAKAIKNYPDALIIGSDQVAMHNDEILGKPHNFENALAQLTKFSGNAVTFYTGLAVLDSKSNIVYSLVEPFIVHFNTLSEDDIINYLHAEEPYNCAGSFKSEALGICLFKKLEGDDPNTLIGLPLIKLIGLFKQHGFNILQEQN